MTPYPERLNRFRVELEKAVALDLDRSRRRSRIVRPIAAAVTAVEDDSVDSTVEVNWADCSSGNLFKR